MARHRVLHHSQRGILIRRQGGATVALKRPEPSDVVGLTHRSPLDASLPEPVEDARRRYARLLCDLALAESAQVQLDCPVEHPLGKRIRRAEDDPDGPHLDAIGS
jgi:hypothetical protein